MSGDNTIRRPVSRVLFPGSDPGRRSFICGPPCDGPGATYPDDMRRRICGCPRSSLFGLAPGGACHAPFLAVGAVRSYRTLSPFPASQGRWSALCCAFPGVTPAGRYPAPCLRGARTFLDTAVSSPGTATAQPPDPCLCREKSDKGQAIGAARAISAAVSSSIIPSIFAGRQRRWNAFTTGTRPAVRS